MAQLQCKVGGGVENALLRRKMMRERTAVIRSTITRKNNNQRRIPRQDGE